MFGVPIAGSAITNHLIWFERMAVVEQGPTFLMRCTVCGSLRHEALHDARLLSASEAASIYHAAMAS